MYESSYFKLPEKIMWLFVNNINAIEYNLSALNFSFFELNFLHCLVSIVPLSANQHAKIFECI